MARKKVAKRVRFEDILGTHSNADDCEGLLAFLQSLLPSQLQTWLASALGSTVVASIAPQAAVVWAALILLAKFKERAAAQQEQAQQEQTLGEFLQELRALKDEDEITRLFMAGDAGRTAILIRRAEAGELDWKALEPQKNSPSAPAVELYKALKREQEARPEEFARLTERIDALPERFRRILSDELQEALQKIKDAYKSEGRILTFQDFRELPILTSNTIFGREAKRCELQDAILDLAKEPFLERRNCVLVEGPGGIGKSHLIASAVFELSQHPEFATLFPNGLFYHEFRPIIKADEEHFEERAIREIPLDSPGVALAEALFKAYFRPTEKSVWYDEEAKAFSPAFWQEVDRPGRLVILDSAEVFENLATIVGRLSRTTLVFGVRPPDRKRPQNFPHARIDLEKLGLDDAVAILQDRSGLDDEHLTLLRELAEKVNGYPLALATLGNTIGQSELPALTLKRLHERAQHYDFSQLGAPGEESRLYNLFDIQADYYPTDCKALLPLFAFAPFIRMPAAVLVASCFTDDKQPLLDAIPDVEAAFTALAKMARLGIVESESDYTLPERPETYYTICHGLFYGWLQSKYLQGNSPPGTLLDRFVDRECTYIEEAIVQNAHGWIDPQDLTERALKVNNICNRFTSAQASYTQWVLAVAYKSARKRAEALQAYKKHLELVTHIETATNIAITYDHIGVIHYEEQQWANSLKAFKKAIQLKRSSKNYKLLCGTYHNIGMVYAEQHRCRRALIAYKLALKYSPEDRMGTIYNSIGNLYSDQEKWPKALESYQKSLNYRQCKNTGTAYHNIGLVHEKQHHWKEAIQAYRSSVEFNERTGMLHLLGLTYYRMGAVFENEEQWPEAVQAYQNAIKAYKRVGDIEKTCSIYAEIGLALYKQGQWPQALQAYQNQLTIVSSDKNSEYKQGQIYQKIGIIYEQQHLWNEAIRAYQYVVKSNQLAGRLHDLGETYYQIGRVHQEQHQWPEALQAFQQALEADQRAGRLRELGETYYQIGRVHRQQHQWPEALQAYQRALEADQRAGRLRELGETYYQIGRVHQEQRQWPEALQAYQQALEAHQRAGRLRELGDTLAQLTVLFAQKANDPSAREDGDAQSAAGCALKAFENFSEHQPHVLGFWISYAYWVAKQFLPDKSGKLGELWELLENIFEQNPGLKEQLDTME
ncbi:MAG: tetratricopeptide repeat protein [Verrucomicrobiota bacterium JB022]|nr:tetratricopeptide repeat protein [Verrucomicrobiota bacterium JB022]